MKKVFIAMLFALLACFTSENLYADNCRVCGGSGKKYIPGMSTNGISTAKKTCSRCGQTFTEGSGHWCICTACGGTSDDGRVRSKSSREEREEDAAARALLDGMDLLSDPKHTYVNNTNSAAPTYFDSTKTSHKRDSSPILIIIIIAILLIIGGIIYKKWKINKDGVKSPKAEIMLNAKESEDNNIVKNTTTVENINTNNNLGEATENDSHDEKNEDTTSSHENVNNNNNFFEFVKTQTSELKDVIDNYDSDKVKEEIQSSISIIKDTGEDVIDKVKKFMIDHDVAGKLKFLGQLILALIFTTCKFVLKAILVIIKVLVQVATQLIQLISSFIKKQTSK